jgi:ribosomal protein S27AE
LSDEDAIMWFWNEKEMSENDEDKKEESDDEIVSLKKCPKCGSRMVLSEDKRKWFCPSCK